MQDKYQGTNPCFINTTAHALEYIQKPNRSTSPLKVMEQACAGVICGRFKPHLLVVLVQIGYSILYFMTQVSFNHGLNPHAYVTYRCIIGSLALFPFAYIIERKVRPRMTLALFAEIFVLSLFGIGLSLNLYFASLTYTSPTFIASMLNTVGSLTFILAIILRLEVVDLRHLRGMAKVIGTLVSLAGTMTMSLYKGPDMRSVNSAPIHIAKSIVHENWMKGSIYAVVSCMSWSISYILQAIVLKKYPAQMSLSVWMNFLGGTQSAVFIITTQRKLSVWSIPYNTDFWTIIYAGIICSGLLVWTQLWCTKQKGPVFVTMFNPLSAIMVAVLAYFIVGQRLHTGSLIGGALVIMGLYLLLWGKEGDQAAHIKGQEKSSMTEDEKKQSNLENALD
ncbi:EamA domain [Dillenia turbinata]|uniref:WAT1-related protein n=1 Tax=Dillenia turbinata TaxID=194707 RepID=A0AAN8W373_9MAGN